jgi:hypothetical protein
MIKQNAVLSMRKPIIKTHVLTGSMDRLYRDALLEQSEAIIESADSHDILLNHLISSLRSKNYLNEAQEQTVRSKNESRDRIFCLIQFLSTEGQKAFEELCNSLEAFGTDGKKELANLLRMSLRKKRDDAVPCPGESNQVSYSVKHNV